MRYDICNNVTLTVTRWIFNEGSSDVKVSLATNRGLDAIATGGARL